jgi:hypothetical protein
MAPVKKQEYKIQTAESTVSVLKDPHNPELAIIHAYVPIRNFMHGKLPDDVNPRSHDKLSGKVPHAIEETLKENPTWFHLLNRGLLILAESARYDKASQTLHFVLGAPDEHGVADGATTDRTLAAIKASAGGEVDFDLLKGEDIPEHLRDASVHIEIIAGEIGPMLVPLASARNTSIQVKEFALENLGGGFDKLREVLDGTEFKGRIRYRENDPEPVDVRTVLGLMTLFHPKWNEERKEPVMAYTNKGTVLSMYQDDAWRPGYEKLRGVAGDILRLYDYIHVHFSDAYEKSKQSEGQKAKFGARKEVRFNERRKYTLPLTQVKTSYFLPDGWLYPILGAFRMLLNFDGKTAAWTVDPFGVFDEVGPSLTRAVTETSSTLANNPQAVGKNRTLWNTLRQSIELKRINMVGLEQPSRRSERKHEPVPVGA